MKIDRTFVGLLALLAACTESTTPSDPKGIVLTATSPTSLTVTAGSGVTDLPTVIATDEYGSPREGILVHYVVSAGKGQLIGETGVTDKFGISQLKGWKPDPIAGPSAVTANAPNGSGVVFAVRVVAGPPSVILKIAGDNQIAGVKSAVAIQPKVKVTDAYGNPTGSVQVRAAVVEGGGSVTPAEVISDSTGTVTFSSWTLGDEGVQRLLLSAGILAQAFHAIAVAFVPGCSQGVELVTVSTLAAQLSTDCISNGRLYTIFYMNAPSLSAWEIGLKSAAFDSYLELRDENSRVIARNDDVDGLRDSRIRALLSGGTYQVVVASNSPGIGGSFSLSLNPTLPVPVGCDPLFVTKGVSTGGQLPPLTCNGVAQGNATFYRIHLAAGDNINVSLQDRSYSGDDIEIMDDNGKTLATGINTTSYLDYGATYSTDKDIDLIVKISSVDTYAEYTIAFR